MLEENPEKEYKDYKEEEILDESGDSILDEEGYGYDGVQDGMFEYDEEELFPECHYVAGYREDEVSPDMTYDRNGYTNVEINEHLYNYFRFFGSKDKDIIYLYFLSRKKQKEIMEILGKSQPAVSYDVTRIKEQMMFVVKIMSFVDAFILFITSPSNKLSTHDKEMLTLFFYSTSIVKTSRLMGINNITCRSHLITIINKLKSSGNIEMYDMFSYIMSNLNNVKKMSSDSYERMIDG